ncbi:MAG: tetratricopeptide repeat protein, partial [Bacteroidota bacterium]
MTRRLALLIFVLVGAQKCDSQELTPDSSRFDATSEIIRATNIANRATKMISQLQYYRALMLLDKAYSIVSAAKGKSDPLSGAALYVKAEVTRSMGMHAEAALLYQRALSVLEMYPGAYHSMLANTLDGYALVLWTQGLSNKARLHHERGLAIREQALGPTHPDVAISLDNLATTLVAMGHYNDARLYLERGLAIREATLGPDHPIVARSINDLADFIALMDDYDQALPLYERALAILEIALGPNHRSVANSLNKIALLHHESGSYAAARPLYERALAIREAALSPSHDAIAVSVNNLAALLHASGNLSEAKQMFERALAILDAAPIPNYGSISAVSNNMGILLVDMGYLDIAIGYYERAISIRKEELKLDHLYAQSTNNLARLYDIAGDYESAHSLYLRAVRIYEAHWAQVLPSLSFAEQLAFIGRNNHVITSALLSSSRAPIDLFIYYPFVARWKGLLLHSLRTQTAVNALATDPAYSQDVSALQAARANLVALQDRMSTLSLADWQARRDELTAEKERLERILAAALPEGVFTDPLRADDYPGLPVYLKPGEAFADVFRYGYRERGRFVEHRYAIVLSWDSTIVLQTASGANPVLIDLGNADELEAAVAAWRSAVTFERSAATVQSALAERLWAPLA